MRRIDADALKEAVNKADFDFGCYYDHTCDTQEMVNRIIDNAPTVEQPTGEWIEETVPVALVGRGNRQCTCSNCGHGDIQAKTQEVPYCWFCGAKMKGGEENEKSI